MESARVAAAAAAQAPWFIGLISGLIGTLVGGFVTALSNWWLQKGRTAAEVEHAARQAERDHARWLRERRFDAYKNFLVDADFSTRSYDQRKDDGDLSDEVAKDMVAAVGALGLLGPGDLFDLAIDYQDVALEQMVTQPRRGEPSDWNSVRRARTRVAIRMQEVLGVPVTERHTIDEDEATA